MFLLAPVVILSVVAVLLAGATVALYFKWNKAETMLYEKLNLNPTTSVEGSSMVPVGVGDSKL